MDCDEFLVLDAGIKISASRELILDHLDSLIGEPRVLRIPYQLANHPLQPDLYHFFDFYKVFFGASTFATLDHGHHSGTSRHADGFRDTRLVQLHFHFKRFDAFQAQARRSWIGSASPDNKEELLKYAGDSMHLAPFFLKDERQYYEGFLGAVHLHIPEFRSLLTELGAPLDLPRATVSDDLVIRPTIKDGDAVLDGSRTVILIPQKTGDTPGFAVSEFDERRYLAANPDLARADINLTAHFLTYGFKEGRRLRAVKGGQTLEAEEQRADPAGADPSARARTAIASYLSERQNAGFGGSMAACLELGGGDHARPGWIVTDFVGGTHALALDVTRPFPIASQSFDYIFAEHMIEHLSFEGGRFMLEECFRVLKPGGTLRVTTPSIGFLLRLFSDDKTHLEQAYIDWATTTFMPEAPKKLASFVFNNFVRAWGHQFIYDRPTLRYALEAAGLTELQECALSHSVHPTLRQLERADRMPEGFLALESMTFEATRPLRH